MVHQPTELITRLAQLSEARRRLIDQLRAIEQTESELISRMQQPPPASPEASPPDADGDEAAINPDLPPLTDETRERIRRREAAFEKLRGSIKITGDVVAPAADPNEWEANR